MPPHMLSIDKNMSSKLSAAAEQCTRVKGGGSEEGVRERVSAGDDENDGEEVENDLEIGYATR